MSKLFQGLERIEAARENIKGLSFMSGLFLGKPDFNILLPTKEPEHERLEGEAYCRKIEAFLKANVDGAKIERTGKIPKSVLNGLLKIGAFGMKIPKEYGGLGFSHKNYGRVLTLIASESNILSLTVAVPQSIGIGMPIMLYGTQAQKDKYLPLVADKAISAFALTEPDTGSDAANVKTRAELDADGQHYTVNGEKLWCTNSPIADYITLIARVPAYKVVEDGKTRWHAAKPGEPVDDHVHTALILDMKSAGVEVRQRCQFEGCRGIENGHLLFSNVKIPAENVIGDIGAGLRYALSILNIGRAVSVPAICLGMAKQAWQPTLDRANTRATFGQPLASRQTQQARIGDMAMKLFAMEALCELAWHMADQKEYDVRIEAAITKIICSEDTIAFLNDAQVIFGGAGYETADSKRFRGLPAFGLEQLVRDATMYRIGEGATDILRPFVAREGLNPHLEMIKDSLGKPLSNAEILRLARHYVPWYLSLWFPNPVGGHPALKHYKVQRRMAYVEATSRKLARTVFYAMMKHQENMQDDQGRQNRIDIVGEELFAIAAAALHAHRLNHAYAWDLADAAFQQAKPRITAALQGLMCNDDEDRAAIGRRALHGKYRALNNGILQRGLEDYRDRGD